MEQHPVPQNVTTFQFRLIGDMTLKQFGYLAGGAILAYIFYRLPLPFFFSWPLTVLSVLAGFGLAFVPVEERPMDVWILSFFKSIYSPTQFVWQRLPETPAPPAAPPPTVRPTPPAKPGGLTPPGPTPKSLSESLQQFFAFGPKPGLTPASPAPKPAVPSLGPTAPSFWGKLQDWFNPKSPPPTPSKAASPPFPGSITPSVLPSVTGKRLDLTPPPKVVSPPPAPSARQIDETKARAANLEKKLHQLEEAVKTKTTTEARFLELQEQLTQLLAERDKMEKEILRLRQKLERDTATSVQPAAIPTPPPTTPSPTVKVMTGQAAIKSGLPRLTTFPNVVTGIIKDQEGNLLPGILVTVRDKEGIPLRALKTNKLGQFAASTPLPHGTYLVEIEDPRGRFTFDRVQITLTGTVLPAIEIIAKSQKEITRAKLAQEIFGHKSIS